MNTLQKYLAMACTGAVAALGIGLLLKAAGCRHHAGFCEKAGKGLDGRLHESIEMLNKATVHVQSVFEQLKNRKA
jgi:hypothetical protein